MPNMPKIKVFSTPTCPYCVTLKEYLKDNKIDFEAIDVSEDKAGLDEMVKKSGQMGVPVITIDDEVIIGFDRVKIDKSLNIE